MTAFEIVCYVCMAVMAIALVANLVLILTCRRDTSRAVLTDAVFYPMVTIFVVWSFNHDSSIVYEIVLLAGLLGLLTTVSMARLLSKGRR